MTLLNSVSDYIIHLQTDLLRWQLATAVLVIALVAILWIDQRNRMPVIPPKLDSRP
jgi:hypothetical protein